MDTRRLETRHLEYFLAVVDNGGVTAASGALHIAQPSVSQSVRALERDLGAELFARVGRRLVLTPAGNALIDPARQALRDLANARAAVAAVMERRAGELDVAAVPALAVDPLARLTGITRRRYPGISVRIAVTETAPEVVELVRHADCEIGIVPLPLATAGMVAHPLGDQSLSVVAPPDWLRDGAETLSLRELSRLPLVAGPPGSSTRTLLDATLESIGAVPSIAVETVSREAIVPLVLNGAGAALLSSAQAIEAGRRGATVLRTRPSITRRMALIHRDAVLSPQAEALVEVAADAARDNAER